MCYSTAIQREPTSMVNIKITDKEGIVWSSKANKGVIGGNYTAMKAISSSQTQFVHSNRSAEWLLPWNSAHLESNDVPHNVKTKNSWLPQLI